MILKKVAGICFGIAFLMAIVLFANVGRDYISFFTARYIFIGSGALGLLLNLFSFQSGKNSPLYNFLYWTGSIVVFAGLIFLIMHWPFGYYIIVTGLIIVGLSFILPESLAKGPEKENDLLDDLQ